MIDQGRIFGKVSIIDILIIAAITLGLIWFFVIRHNDGNVIAPEDEMFIITYFSPSYPEFVTDYIAVGDSIEDFIRGGHIGTIIKLTVDQGYDVQPGSDGILVKSPKEGYEQIEIVSEILGRSSENGVIINGHAYLVGSYVTIRAGTGKLFIMLTGIQPKGGL